MKKIFKKSIIALMVVLFSATLAMAKYGGNQNANNQDNNTPTRAQDQSCQ